MIGTTAFLAAAADRRMVRSILRYRNAVLFSVYCVVLGFGVLGRVFRGVAVGLDGCRQLAAQKAA